MTARAAAKKKHVVFCAIKISYRRVCSSNSLQSIKMHGLFLRRTMNEKAAATHGWAYAIESTEKSLSIFTSSGFLLVGKYFGLLLKNHSGMVFKFGKYMEKFSHGVISKCQLKLQPKPYNIANGIFEFI